MMNKKENPKAVVAFAGGGGVEAGMVEAGIQPILAIEKDPYDPALSNKMIKVHKANFPCCSAIDLTVEEWAASGCTGLDGETVDFFHCSPVCANYSIAKANRQEEQKDIDSAEAICVAINILKPSCFTLENVNGYLESKAFKTIANFLEYLSYHLVVFKVNASLFGVAQSRERIFAIATKREISEPDFLYQKKTWLEAIAREDFEPSDLTRRQKLAISEYIGRYPVLVERVGRTKPRVIAANTIVPTITKSMFCDRKGSGRKHCLTFWDGTRAYNIGIKNLARLQGFPEWYSLKGDDLTNGSIIGYAVPPLMSKAFFSYLVKELYA
jgi:DNA (cytosine-5)-methyltransferase 1